MARVLVWKGRSACLVEKNRGQAEIYIGSLGAISHAKMAEYRARLKHVPQEERITFCKKNFGFVVPQEDITREKYPELPYRKKLINDKPAKKSTKKETKKTDKKRTKKTVKKRFISQPVRTIPHTKIMMERHRDKKEIAASKIQPFGIPSNLKKYKSQKDYLNTMESKALTGIMQCKQVIREEEIRMPTSLYAQRKEKAVIGRKRADIKGLETSIKRIDLRRKQLRKEMGV